MLLYFWDSAPPDSLTKRPLFYNLVAEGAIDDMQFRSTSCLYIGWPKKQATT